MTPDRHFWGLVGLPLPRAGSTGRGDDMLSIWAIGLLLILLWSVTAWVLLTLGGALPPIEGPKGPGAWLRWTLIPAGREAAVAIGSAGIVLAAAGTRRLFRRGGSR
jgi:hypothetical protein